jgi:hypothetical protein
VQRKIGPARTERGLEHSSIGTPVERDAACAGLKPDRERADCMAMWRIGSQRSDPDAERRAPRRRRWKFLLAVIGATAAGSLAYAASNWVVGLAGGSSGEAQSASVSNLTITAVASPAATNLLYPGGNGDVVVSISNPNPFPVTITAVQLPTNLTYANGYTTSALSVTQTGCLTATPSDVIWNYSTGSSGSSHTLTTPLTVAASAQPNNPLAVTMTNDASMTAAAPAACVNTFFSMPSLTGVTATGGAATPTTSPTTDSWTS